jgi:hypothetical protein
MTGENMSLLRSVTLQAKAERVLEQEKVEARISALQDLRFEICRIIDDLITREGQPSPGSNDEEL